MRTGERGDYVWLIAEELPHLLATLVRHHQGARLLVTSMDSARFVPRRAELESGWTSAGSVAISPPLTRELTIPSAGFDEWYVLDDLPREAFAPEVFVNHIPFPLIWTATFAETPRPLEDGEQWHADATERFWAQLAALRPVSYVARASSDVVVSRRPDLIRDLSARLASEAVFRISSIDPAIIRRESERVLALVCSTVPSAEVLEVGSTAIPHVVGKQDVDLLVRVPEQLFAPTRAALDGAFSRNPDQLSNARYQGYTVPSELDVAIQLTVAGCEHDRFVQFLDALRTDPALVQRYNALKRAWDGHAMNEYRAAKADFIEQALLRAERGMGAFTK